MEGDAEEDGAQGASLFGATAAVYVLAANMEGAVGALEDKGAGGAIEGPGYRDEGIQAEKGEAKKDGLAAHLTKSITNVSLGGSTIRVDLHA